MRIIFVGVGIVIPAGAGESVAIAAGLGPIVVVGTIAALAAHIWWGIPSWIFKSANLIGLAVLLIFLQGILRLGWTGAHVNLALVVVCIIFAVGFTTAAAGAIGFRTGLGMRVAVISPVIALLAVALASGVDRL